MLAVAMENEHGIQLENSVRLGIAETNEMQSLPFCSVLI